MKKKLQWTLQHNGCCVINEEKNKLRYEYSRTNLVGEKVSFENAGIEYTFDTNTKKVIDIQYYGGIKFIDCMIFPIPNKELAEKDYAKILESRD